MRLPHPSKLLLRYSHHSSDFRWLVIFDNTERSEDLDQFWPSGGNGKIIVTTRHPGIGFQLTDDEVFISPFTPAEGRDCILSLASWPGGVAQDPEPAQELSVELGGLPIGIIHMTALMRSRKTPMKRFLGDYRRNKFEYHNKDARGIAGVYSDAKPKVGTNWTMSFDALDNQAKSLLGVMCFLYPDAIPQDLFKHWDDSASRSTSGLLGYCNDVEEYTGYLFRVGLLQITLTNCLYCRYLDVEEQLMDLALVEKDPQTEMLSLHRLEQFQVQGIRRYTLSVKFSDNIY